MEDYQKPSKEGILQHLLQNIIDSRNGLRIMFRESSTFHRIYPMMLVGGIGLGLIFDFIPLEYIVLAAIFIFDVEAETTNTAIEEACNAVTHKRNEHIKRSKDIASAVVYIAHLCYIAVALFFTIAHGLNFEWWTRIIPA